MESSTTDPLLQWLSSAGSLGILAAAVVAFIRGWVVPGSAHHRVLTERDRCHTLIETELKKIDKRLQRIEHRTVRSSSIGPSTETLGDYDPLDRGGT